MVKQREARDGAFTFQITAENGNGRRDPLERFSSSPTFRRKRKRGKWKSSVCTGYDGLMQGHAIPNEA
jgi:hypothetical protein